MLIPLETLIQKYGLKITGVIHGGAHLCEEMSIYLKCGIPKERVLWFEANPQKIQECLQNDPNLKIFHTALSDVSGQKVNLKITNNGQSSSLLDLGTHQDHYPDITVVNTIEVETQRLDEFLDKKELDDGNFNFLNLDLQGVELSVLKGLGDKLKNIEAAYLEVNFESVYQGCALVAEIDEYLATFGLYRVETVDTGRGWGDALYTKKIQKEYGLKLVESLTNMDHHPENNGEYLLFTSLATDIKTIFDVGARDDTYFFQFQPNAFIHLFEPNPRHFKTLKNKLESQKLMNRCNVNCLGLGARNDEVEYYSDTESITPRTHHTTSTAIPFIIKICRLDDYCQEHDVKSIDFLKIDTEGYELDVLQGAEKMLPNIKFIQFEYGGTYLDREITLSQVLEFLGDTWYFYFLQTDGLFPITLDSVKHYEKYQYANILASKVSIF